MVNPIIDTIPSDDVFDLAKLALKTKMPEDLSIS